MALGASYVALADDALASLWNPAGIPGISTAEVNLGYQKEPGEVTYGHLMYAHPFLKKHGIGAAIGTLQTGRVEFADLAGNERSIRGQADWLVALGYGASVLPSGSGAARGPLNLSAGATVKYLYTSAGVDLKDHALAVDLGFLASLPVLDAQPPLRIGGAWQNLGGHVKLGTVSDPVEQPVRLGMAQAVRWNHEAATTLQFEVLRVLTREHTEFHFGGEHVMRVGKQQTLALRLGHQEGVDVGGLSFGLGVTWDFLGFDYAFAPAGPLGSLHRVGLRLTLG